MRTDDIDRLHARHKVPGSGPVSADEAACMLRAIEEHRPRSFIEVGTSSGLSTGLLALMLHDNGGERLVSVDVSERFYRDDSVRSGFLVPQLYDGDRVTVELRSPLTSVDLAGGGESFEMGFVDGSHQHPWPLVDTLSLLPLLTGPKLLFHHDLNLYQRPQNAKSVGPKYLFDQFPESHRTRYDANRGNLFSLDLSIDQGRLEAIAIEAFLLPWTGLRWRGSRGVLEGFRTILRTHYSPELLRVFDDCAERFRARQG
jgi:hypothetical protein